MAKPSFGLSLPLLHRTETQALGLRDLIYKTCVEAIVDGRWPAGARVASARRLAADWRVARSTVDDALARLQSEGFLDRRVGNGSFVAARVGLRGSGGRPRKPRRTSLASRRALAAVSHRGRVASEAYAPNSVPRPQAFVAGLPALDAFPLALWNRLAARRGRAAGAALMGYLPPLGLPALREATARHLALARGIACAAQQIMIVTSSMQAIDLAARVLLERGDVAWIEDPGFPNVRAALAMAGARISPIRVDAEGIDIDRGAQHAPAARLVHVTPSCQYPTGAALSLERRLALLEQARRMGAWIVEDDYQSEFSYAGRPIVPIASLDRIERTLYVGTYTNAVFPSLRLAYVVLPPRLIAVFEAVRRQLDDHTHWFMQAVLSDFIDGGHFHAHLRAMRARYQLRRDELVAACVRELPDFAQLGPTTGGMNAALHFHRRLSDRAVAERAAGVKVRVLPLSRYAHGAQRVNGLLLGYAALTEKQIAAGVAALAKVLRASS